MTKTDEGKHAMVDSAPEWCRIKDACARFGIGKTQLYALMGRESEIRCRKVGKLTLVHYGSLNAFIENRPAPVLRRYTA
jgi:hypothetical protein